MEKTTNNIARSHGENAPARADIANLTVIRNLPSEGHALFFSDFSISPREFFRAEICSINGRENVRLSRWKRSASGPPETGRKYFRVCRLSVRGRTEDASAPAGNAWRCQR